MNPPIRFTLQKGTSLPQDDLVKAVALAIRRRYASEFAAVDPARADSGARQMARALLEQHLRCQQIGATNEVLRHLATSKKFEDECQAADDLLDTLVVIKWVDHVDFPIVTSKVKSWLEYVWRHFEDRLGPKEEDRYVPAQAGAPRG
jgi:hypothetical protein